MKVTFIHLSEFTHDAKRLGLNDDAIRELEDLIMQSPERGKLIAGTGGLRKIRFVPGAAHTGKSGANRVLYTYIVRGDVVFLVAAFAKNEKENISPAEKNEYRAMLKKLERMIP